MRTHGPCSDRISNLPQDIIEQILTLVPIRDALRTSILSKKWRYCWRGMPKLRFTNFVEVASDCGCEQSKKYKLVNAIFHVLLLHNGPTVVEFDWAVGELGMVSESDLMMSYLSRGNSVKELFFSVEHDSHQKLPLSFFSLQGLEGIHIENCDFGLPSTFNGFSRLRWLDFLNVEISAKTLHRFISNCPLLEDVTLGTRESNIDFAAGENKFTFVELLQCVPLIKRLDISTCYMKYLSVGGMPHKLTTSLVHLKHLELNVCLMEQDEISSALCIMRSSPVLEKIIFMMYEDFDVGQTPINFLDHEEHSGGLNLDRLEVLEMICFENSPLQMGFVKLIMAKSPVLKKVRLELWESVSLDEEQKMLERLLPLPFPQTSQPAKLIIEYG